MAPGSDYKDPLPRVTAFCKGLVFGLWILVVLSWLQIVHF